MTILRWIMLTAVLVVFLLLSVANWTPVPFNMPDGTKVIMPLPLLLATAFILGWLPTWLFHIGAKLQLKRKLAQYTRSASDAPPSTMPTQSQPAIVPPAGA